MLVMVWDCGGPSREMEAREGLPRAVVDCCLPSSRLARSTLEEPSVTARKTVSQQVQQVSKRSIIFCKESQNGTDMCSR